MNSERTRREFLHESSRLLVAGSALSCLVGCGEQEPVSEGTAVGPEYNIGIEQQLKQLEIERAGELTIGSVNFVIYGDDGRMLPAEMTQAINFLAQGTPQGVEGTEGIASAYSRGVAAILDPEISTAQIDLVLERDADTCLYRSTGRQLKLSRHSRPSNDWFCGEELAGQTQIISGPVAESGRVEILMLIPHFPPTERQSIGLSGEEFTVSGKQFTQAAFLHEMVHAAITVGGRAKGFGASTELEEDLAQEIEAQYIAALFR